MATKFTEALKKKIKAEFIEGYIDDEGVRNYPSIEALAKRHDVSRATIYRHSNPNKEDWQKAKNQYQSKMSKEVEETRLRDLVAESQALDKNSLQIAQALLSRVGRKLARSMEDERNNPESQGLSPAELRELSHVTANAQKIGKLALGEAQEISKVSADVSAPESYNNLIRHLEGLANQKAALGKHTIQ